MSRRARQRSSLAMLVIVGLFAANPIIVGAHLLLRPHYWCPEHRTMEDARRDRHDGVVYLDSLHRWEHGEQRLPTPREHVKCHLLELSQRVGSLVSTDVETHCLPLVAEVYAAPSRQVRATARILDLAPKHSPPA